MPAFRSYIRPQSLEEAYQLCLKPGNLLIGGMLWSKMLSLNYNTAVDLCDLHLDFIKEEKDCFRIGAMTPLRSMEIHKGLDSASGGAFREALRPIVGVQFRNGATAGGSVWGRYGFSDVMTLFMALGARVELFHGGVMDIRDFASMSRKVRDVLVQIILPRDFQETVYLSQRNSATDFPVLTCAFSRVGGRCQCAVGARPGMAALVADAEGVLSPSVTESGAEAFADKTASLLEFGSNMRAGAEYRRHLCRVLVRRAAMMSREVLHGN